MQKPQLILASTSQARKTLLERFKIPFICRDPNVDETTLDQETPDKLVLRLAKEKAFTVRDENALVIGADQVGIIDNCILGKPLTHENAVKQLLLLSGKTMHFLIGLCVLDTRNQEYEVALERVDVVMRTFTRETIERYLQKESVLNCAGSLKVEGLGIALLDSIQCDDYTALIGLPLMRLSKMLENRGFYIV